MTKITRVYRKSKQSHLELPVKKSIHFENVNEQQVRTNLKVKKEIQKQVTHEKTSKIITKSSKTTSLKKNLIISPTILPEVPDCFEGAKTPLDIMWVGFNPGIQSSL